MPLEAPPPLPSAALPPLGLNVLMRLTLRSFEALPASYSTSAVRYSRMAAEYTAEVAPTRPPAVARCLRKRWIRPTGN